MFQDSSPVTTKFTYEDYLKTSDDERYELLDGELIIMPPAPSIAHQSRSGHEIGDAP